MENWDPRRHNFLKWDVAKVKFSFEEVYHELRVKLIEFYKPLQGKVFKQQHTQLTPHEWVGMYRNTEDILPEWVVCASYLKEFSLGPVQFNVEFMNIFPTSTLLLQYFTLTKMKTNIETATPLTAFSIWMAQIGVDSLTRGSNHTKFKLLFGKLDQLFFDLV